MEPEASIPRSDELAVGPYAQPPATLFPLTPILYNPHIFAWDFQVVYCLPVFFGILPPYACYMSRQSYPP